MIKKIIIKLFRSLVEREGKFINLLDIFYDNCSRKKECYVDHEQVLEHGEYAIVEVFKCECCDCHSCEYC